MKTILLSAKVLSKTEQKAINGGALPRNCSYECKKTGEVTTSSGCLKATCGGCNIVCI